MNDPACEGIIGSIAYRFDGDRLRLVRFVMSEKLALDLQQGRTITLKRLVSYEQVKETRARQGQRHRARKKAHALSEVS